MSRRQRIRAVRAAAALIAVTALAAGCSSARVPSAPDPGPAHTAVTPLQALGVLSAVDAAVVRAVESRDAAQLGNRASGPAKEALTAAIAVQAALKQDPSAPASPTVPRLVLTLSGPWPRWFLAAGSSPNAPTPVVQVLRSADARSPYGLWASLNLLPGAALPELASATVGSRLLAADAAGLALRPADVLAHYTDLLNRGGSSAYSAEFSDDIYRKQLITQLGTDRQAFGPSGVGEVLDAHTAAADPPLAIATLDGGALVIGRIDQRYTLTVNPGQAAKADPQLAALAGRPTFSKNVERRSVEVLAFHVPKAGTSDKISLIAASKSDTGASGS